MIGGGHPSLLVTLDGMAGAGKTTTVRLLGPHLRNMGYRVHTTAEPTSDMLGELARHNTDLYRAESLACLVAADRYHHLETEIEPHLQEGEIVVCDRYIASSYVLQQLDGVPLAFVDALNSRARRPDLAVLLVTDPAVAASRVAVRGAHDRFQGGISASKAEAGMYSAAASYLSRLGTPAVLVIDTTNQELRQVVETIAQRIADRLAEPSRYPNDQGANA
ncbi:thymidylate kinase [Saccharomonospora azurea SZMC 14600]|uniref:dTMP kinase n=1 Tax=Saccharomonospora azurea TaxID=40988 RepID=UPI00024007D9|nr:dTMP kinase [Saccharomonospora azurea]EHK88714.1 thymidylate kinase [Saccharomonospora azurea SZMC 14600]